jgi:hypothetical protein
MLTICIVGSFYRPGAQNILKFLPPGTDLYLIREPDNEYDPNAVAVYISPKDIPQTCYEKLKESLLGCGLTLDYILKSSKWQLGYLPRNVSPQWIIDLGGKIPAKFALLPSGKPVVTIEDEN